MIPREILFGNPEKNEPRISPDGTRLAFTASYKGVLNVWVKSIDKDDDHPITFDTGRGIRSFFWARNNLQVAYIQDKNGDENWHLWLNDADGGKPVDLTPIEGVQVRVIAVDPKHPDTILVGINDRIPQLHDVYKINLTNGERELVLQNDIGAYEWLADHDMNIRLGQVAAPDGGFILKHRCQGSIEWKILTKWSSEDAFGTKPVIFAQDNRTLYMTSSVGSNSAELRTLDTETGEEKVIVSDKTYDVSEYLFHPITHELQAVAFNQDRLVWKALDPAIQTDLDTIACLQRGDFHVIRRDDLDQTWLISFTRDIGATVYYVYSRKRKKGTFLFSTRPKLYEYRLSETNPITFTSRDGLEIHGYLTIPDGHKPKNLPSILHVHGGPWSRVTWGFDQVIQFLADRGYAVLQVNFRGSTGYGKDFTNAGDKEWGGRMQDDITDATQWLVDQGIADPNRIGIYGSSYGGFAVLSALTKTPHLFRCGVDIFGPSDLLSFQNSIPPYWEPVKPLLHRRIGHPEHDRAMLEERSPLKNIGKIVAPLMIVQGTNDPRVKSTESIQIRDALLEAGKTVEYLEFDNEGHGIVRPESRLRFFKEVEKFLADHLS